MRPSAAGLLVIATLYGGEAAGQSSATATPTEASNNDLSKESENPVSRTITLPLRYEADFRDGPYNATKNTFELDQAILPFRLNDDWALITRTKFPTYSQPPKKLGDHWASGIGNGYTTFFLSPSRGEGFYWGAGPVLYYPSATDTALGVNKWGSGPSVAFIRKKATPLGIWCCRQQHLVVRWSAPEQRPHQQPADKPIHQLPFWRWLVGRIIAEHRRKLAVEVGTGLDGPCRRRHRQDIPAGRPGHEAGLDSYYNAIRPQAGHETWLLQITLTFLFPT